MKHLDHKAGYKVHKKTEELKPQKVRRNTFQLVSNIAEALLKIRTYDARRIWR